MAWSTNRAAPDGPCNFQRVDVAPLSPVALRRKIDQANEPLLLTNFGAWGASISDRVHFIREWGDLFVKSVNGAEFTFTSPEEAAEDGTTTAVPHSLGAFAEREGSSTASDAYVFYNISGTAALQRLLAEMPRTLRSAVAGGVHRNSSLVRLSYSGSGSGLLFHVHLAAINAVIAGRKRWFAFSSEISLAGEEVGSEALKAMRVLARHDFAQPPGHTAQRGMRDWLQLEHSKPEVADAWGRVAWECTQKANEVVVMPALLTHGVLNLDETLAVVFEREEMTSDSDTRLTPGRPLHGLVDEERTAFYMDSLTRGKEGIL